MISVNTDILKVLTLHRDNKENKDNNGADKKKFTPKMPNKKFTPNNNNLVGPPPGKSLDGQAPTYSTFAEH